MAAEATGARTADGTIVSLSPQDSAAGHGLAAAAAAAALHDDEKRRAAKAFIVQTGKPGEAGRPTRNTNSSLEVSNPSCP
jgi:hypothetical protein